MPKFTLRVRDRNATRTFTVADADDVAAVSAACSAGTRILALIDFEMGDAATWALFASLPMSQVFSPESSEISARVDGPAAWRELVRHASNFPVFRSVTLTLGAPATPGALALDDAETRAAAGHLRTRMLRVHIDPDAGVDWADAADATAASAGGVLCRIGSQRVPPMLHATLDDAIVLLKMPSRPCLHLHVERVRPIDTRADVRDLWSPLCTALAESPRTERFLIGFGGSDGGIAKHMANCLLPVVRRHPCLRVLVADLFRVDEQSDPMTYDYLMDTMAIAPVLHVWHRSPVLSHLDDLTASETAIVKILNAKYEKLRTRRVEQLSFLSACIVARQRRLPTSNLAIVPLEVARLVIDHASHGMLPFNEWTEDEWVDARPNRRTMGKPAPIDDDDGADDGYASRAPKRVMRDAPGDAPGTL